MTGPTADPAAPGTATFAPALTPPAMAVVRHLAQGRQVRLSPWGVRKYEVFDPATGKSKTSWYVSYPALCELVLRGVLDGRGQHPAVTDAARDWIAAQAPPPRIEHRDCAHPATAAAARRCREGRAQHVSRLTAAQLGISPPCD